MIFKSSSFDSKELYENKFLSLIIGLFSIEKKKAFRSSALFLFFIDSKTNANSTKLFESSKFL